MKSQIFQTLGALTLTLHVIAAAHAQGNTRAQSPSELVAMRYATIQDFLASQEGRSAHYSALKRERFRDDHFPREAYDHVLELIAKLVEQVPEAGEELWRVKPNPEVIEINSPYYQTGLRMNHYYEWARTILRIKESYNAQARVMFPDLSPVKIFEAHERWNQEINRFEESLKAIDPTHHGRLRAQFWSNFRIHPEVRALCSWYIFQYLSQQHTTELLNSDNPDHIYEALSLPARQPTVVLAAAGIEEQSGKGFAAEVKRLAPNAEELVLNNRILFKPVTELTRAGTEVEVGATPPGKWVFTEVARKFHASFDPIALNECVGGNPGELGSAHIERCGINAIRGVRPFRIDFRTAKNGIRHFGIYHHVPGTVDGIPVVSLTLSTNAFRRSVLTPSAAGQSNEVPRPVSLFRLWLRQAHQNLTNESDYIGFVLSESNAFESHNVMSFIREHEEYFMGSTIGRGADFIHEDEPGVQKIIDSGAPPEGYARIYVGRMISDATVPQASYRPLVLLDPAGPHLLEQQLTYRSAEEILNRLPLYQRRHALWYFFRHNNQEQRQSAFNTVSNVALLGMDPIYRIPQFFGVFGLPLNQAAHVLKVTAEKAVFYKVRPIEHLIQKHCSKLLEPLTNLKGI